MCDAILDQKVVLAKFYKTLQVLFVQNFIKRIQLMNFGFISWEYFEEIATLLSSNQTTILKVS